MIQTHLITINHQKVDILETLVLLDHFGLILSMARKFTTNGQESINQWKIFDKKKTIKF